ncbi:MAG: hypothetical protein D3922_10040 [Candidatus Electrothrix sp. AR1]|nr:hypothetical protein [Candidatus Electrothrix sp. AR1]
MLLYFSSAGKKSLLLPDGTVHGHPWHGSEIMTYVEPARAFLDTGTFARGGQPDMHRTIGYPLFLSLTMCFFGKYWLPATYLLQVVVFALLFPASSYIAMSLFPHMGKKESWLIVLLLAASGVGLAYTGQLLTDQFFTSLLTAGIACGFIAVRKVSWKMAMAHILLVGYAAQVRPTLGLFFLADCFFLTYITFIWKLEFTRKRFMIITAAMLFLAVAGSGPAIRNYFNHGIFTPTDVLSDNFARYLAGPVMMKEGRGEEFEKIQRTFNLLEGRDRIEARKKFAFSIYLQYPLTTGGRVLYHAFWNLFEPHWEYILNVYDEGFSLNSFFDREGKLKKNIMLGTPFFLYYVLLYSAFFYSIIRTIKCKYPLFFFLGLCFFMLPFVASFINGAGARMRIYAEPFILAVAVYGLVFDLNSLKKLYLHKHLICK